MSICPWLETMLLSNFLLTAFITTGKMDNIGLLPPHEGFNIYTQLILRKHR